MKPSPRAAPAPALPLHVQIEARMRALMARPEYQQGRLLPDELTLANRFGVSRGTLRVVLVRLMSQGLLERKPGVGTRVRKPPGESGIGAWRSFSREMARKGVVVENFKLAYAQAPAEDAAALALHLPPATPLWRLDRVRGWHGQAVLHSRSWFHPRLGLTGAEEFAKPLYEVIEAATGVVAENALEEFTAVAASAPMARLLGVSPGEPLLLRSHTVFDAGGRPIEFAQVHYVSSRFSLTLEIRHESTE